MTESGLQMVRRMLRQELNHIFLQIILQTNLQIDFALS